MPTEINSSLVETVAMPLYAPAQILPNRRIPAWLLSVCLHTLLFWGILLAFQAVQRGASEVENRAGGIVLVDITASSTEYLSEGEVNDNSSAANTEQSPPPLAAVNELPPDLPGLDSSALPITGVGDALAESLPGADSLIAGPAPNRQIGGKITTEVFGIKGTGSKFVYVFDRSKSMEGFSARPLMAAKQELIKSLQSLTNNHQFQIVFYNDGITVFKPDTLNSMYFADEANKTDAVRFVNGMQGDRGTDHLNALKYAFRLGPDVIFLLTDAEGGFTTAELREASELNRSAAIINAIEFGERRGGDHSLESLAIQSGGQYLFKDIRSLQIGN